jgi:hypothetical protein
MTPAPPTPAELTATVALLVTYGCIVGFFVYRYFKAGAAPSLGVALIGSRWVSEAAHDLARVHHSPTVVERWMGVLMGLFLLATAWAMDRHPTKKNPPLGPLR